MTRTYNALMPNPTLEQRREYVRDLLGTIDCPTPMAVVDYLGRRDADGLVTAQTCLRRRYGVRDMRHVKIYTLEVVRLNAAASMQEPM